MTESILEKQVVELCKRRGLLTYKFVSPANRGVPDRIITGCDRVLFLELKAKGRKPSGLQLREIARIKMAQTCSWSVTADWVDNYETAADTIQNFFFS